MNNLMKKIPTLKKKKDNMWKMLRYKSMLKTHLGLLTGNKRAGLADIKERKRRSKSSIGKGVTF